MRLDPLLAEAECEPKDFKKANRKLAQRLDGARCDKPAGRPCRHTASKLTNGRVKTRPPTVPVPSYDEKLRKLSLGDTELRQFRRKAPNQTTILEAFEAGGWPLRIEDPLGSDSGFGAENKLRDAVYGLNRGQRRHLIRFFCDGTGSGVCWELVE